MADEIIGGYRLLNVMHSGQSSQVWEVVEVSSHRHFAMKLLLPEKMAGEERRLLLHEAKVGKQLAHPNVIRIMNVSQEKKNPFIVMEYFPAGSLKQRMRKQMDFIKENCHSILKQAATALAYMNASGWVHRDVKPDNILANSAGDVKLIDFALAQRANQKQGLLARLLRKRAPTAGTRSYMSPEQIRSEPLDGRADIYSFAATAYELTTGRPPFRATSASDLLNKHIKEIPVTPQIHNPDITDEFGMLVLRMLEKKRDKRPRDFHEVLMALKTIKVFKSDVPAKAEGK